MMNIFKGSSTNNRRTSPSNEGKLTIPKGNANGCQDNDDKLLKRRREVTSLKCKCYKLICKLICYMLLFVTTITVWILYESGHIEVIFHPLNQEKAIATAEYRYKQAVELANSGAELANTGIDVANQLANTGIDAANQLYENAPTYLLDDVSKLLEMPQILYGTNAEDTEGNTNVNGDESLEMPQISYGTNAEDTEENTNVNGDESRQQETDIGVGVTGVAEGGLQGALQDNNPSYGTVVEDDGDKEDIVTKNFSENKDDNNSQGEGKIEGKEEDKTEEQNEDKTEEQNEDKTEEQNEDKTEEQNQDKTEEQNQDKTEEQNQDKNDQPTPTKNDQPIPTKNDQPKQTKDKKNAKGSLRKSAAASTN